MNFSAVVIGLDFPKELPIETRACPDQYVGRLSELKAEGGIVQRKPVACRSDKTGLIVILESPHVDEFKGQPAPARGSTGTQIAKHLRSVADLNVDDDHQVILVNAVQYQCSLGKPTHCYRDQVFTATWSSGGRSDFVARLKAAFQAGDLIACCCTKGSQSDPARQLRQLVYHAVRDALPDAKVLRRTHPSSWFSAQNRLHEWDAI